MADGKLGHHIVGQHLDNDRGYHVLDKFLLLALVGRGRHVLVIRANLVHDVGQNDIQVEDGVRNLGWDVLDDGVEDWGKRGRLRLTGNHARGHAGRIVAAASIAGLG